MFAPHLAEINIKRSEPSIKDSGLAASFFHQKISRLVDEVVEKDLLHEPKDPKQLKRIADKLKRQAELEHRAKALEPFMELWNKWRGIYYGAGPLKIETAGQATTIEECLKYAQDRGLVLTILLACVQREFMKYKFRPAYHLVLSRGEELYDKNYNLVMNDIDRMDYERKAINRE